MRRALNGILFTLAAVVIGGCGGSNSSTPTAPSGNNYSVTLSGAVTGTLTYAPVEGGYNDSLNVCTVVGAFSGTINNVTYQLTVAPTFVGTLQAKAYHNTDTGANGGLSLSTATYQTWMAAAGDIAQGSYTVTVASTGTGITDHHVHAYTGGHGTITATLPALIESGSTGTVTVTINY